jgi:glycosyltransferase involved in cell wall biosynthesis
MIGLYPNDEGPNPSDGLDMNINLLAPINSLGYGVASTNVLDQLNALGHEVALFPIGQVDAPQDKQALVKKAQAYAGFYDGQAPSLRIWHQNSLAEHVGHGWRVGYTFFELRQFQPNEIHHMRDLDQLAVASRWAADVCEDNGLARPRVAPLGVDRAIFHPNVRADRWEPDHTIFVNVGKWEVRKGHDVLINAFNKAFVPTDKVILKLATLNPFIGTGNLRWAQLCGGTRMGSRIYIHPDRMATQHDVAKFLVSSDCGVFPSRGEAWNLELLECMSCGLHCIATDYSGHTEFANAGNCRLIRVSDFEDAKDGVWFHGQGQWARLGEDQEDQLIEHMRQIHRLKQTGGLEINAAGIDTATGFDWRATAQALVETFQ